MAGSLVVVSKVKAAAKYRVSGEAIEALSKHVAEVVGKARTWAQREKMATIKERHVLSALNDDPSIDQ